MNLIVEDKINVKSTKKPAKKPKFKKISVNNKNSDVEIELDSCHIIYKGVNGSTQYKLDVNGHDMTKTRGIQRITVDIGVAKHPVINIEYVGDSVFKELSNE